MHTRIETGKDNLNETLGQILHILSKVLDLCLLLYVLGHSA